MATAIREYEIPSSIDAQQIDALESQLLGLRDKQRQIASHTPLAAAITKVIRTDTSWEIHYDTEVDRPLGAFIHGDRPAIAQVLKWSLELCEAFSVVYQAGASPILRHGGLCGGNVILTPTKELRILDFGIAESFASVLQGSDESWVLQVASNVAPEVWDAPNRYTEQSDLFSMSVLVYELMTGQHPFGAIRDDPDDCKYQVLTEIPVPPKKRNNDLDDELSEFVFRGISTDVAHRYQTFSEYLADLRHWSNQSGATSTEVQQIAVKPVPEIRPPAPPTEAQEDQSSREQYLEIQAKLKKERQAGEQRRQQRQEKTRLFIARLKRHSLMISVALLSLVGISAATTAFMTKQSNERRAETILSEMTRDLNHSFAVVNASELAKTLNVEHSARLQKGLEGLRKVAPGTSFGFMNIVYDDFMATRGTLDLQIGDTSIPLPFLLPHDDSTGIISWSGRALADAIVSVADDIAHAQLTDSERKLIESLRGAFEDAAVDIVASNLSAMIPNVSQPLRYLMHQSSTKKLVLGSLELVHGQNAFTSEIALSADGVETTDMGIDLRFDYTCENDGCSLVSVSVLPEQEPAEHRLMCITLSLIRIQQAFTDRDSKALTQLFGADQEDGIEEMLSWISNCREATFQYSLGPAPQEAYGNVRFVPGVLNDRAFETKPFRMVFDEYNEWKPVAMNMSWPRSAVEYVRQEQGQALINRLQGAWLEKNASAYLSEYPSSTRTEAAVATVFERLQEDGVTLSIDTQEDDLNNSALFINLKPVTQASTAQYPQKRMRFLVVDRELVWDGEGDPVWTISGLAYGTLVERLRKQRWGRGASLDRVYGSAEWADLSSEERGELSQWVEEIRSIRQLFEPLSEDYIGGFPIRARLRGTADGVDLIFRLMVVNEAAPYLIYMQEREISVDDVVTQYWTRVDKPWEEWSRITDQPPHNQIVGMSFEDAAAFSEHLGCHLPTHREWLACATQLGDSREHRTPFGFHGGVWELCTNPQSQTQAYIAGGSWIDDDLASRGISGHMKPSPQPIDKHQGHGLVGFRLSRRITVPGIAIQDSPASGIPN